MMIARPTTASPYSTSKISQRQQQPRFIEGNPNPVQQSSQPGGIGSQIFGGMSGQGTGQYYGGASTPEEARAKFSEKHKYMGLIPASSAGGSKFQSGSSFGQNYPTTYYNQPFQNIQAPSRTVSYNKPITEYIPSIRPGQGKFKKTGQKRVTRNNPRYAAQMRDYNIMNLLNQYTNAHNQGKRANEQRYQDILSGYKDLASMGNELYGNRVNQLSGTVGGITDTLDSRYGNRYDQGMSMLQGAGQDERNRINRAFDSQVGSIGQNLTSRGLNNSTIAGSMQNAVERNRAESHTDLSERLRREQLATHTQLSGDQLNALQNNLWSGLGFVDRAQQAQIQNQQQIPLSMLEFMERREDGYPSQAEVIQLMLQAGRGF